MARTKDEIFEFLDNKDALADKLYSLALHGPSSIPCMTSADSMTKEQIEKRESILNYEINEAKEKAKALLDELDFDFQDAMLGVNESEKEAINSEYRQKREALANGVKSIDDICAKSIECFNRFKNGEVLTYDEIYGDVDALKTMGKENPQNGEKQQEDKDISASEAKPIIGKMRELNQAKDEFRKLQKAVRQKKLEDFKKDIEGSGALYLKISEKNKKLLEEYNATIGALRESYNEQCESLDDEEQLLETEQAENCATIIKKKEDLKQLRELPIIQKLERATKAKKRIREMLENTTDDVEKAELEAKLEKAKEVEERIYATDVGKVYRSTRRGIRETKDKIKLNEARLTRIDDKREALGELLDGYIKSEKETLKKNKENLLPEKRSKFMMFIGGLRAKLGIGKHKADKNVADTLSKAIKGAGDITAKVGEFAVGSAIFVGKGIGQGIVAAKEGIENAGQSISEYCTTKKEKVIAKIENHIDKRIVAEKQKSQEAMQKLNPTQGER